MPFITAGRRVLDIEAAGLKDLSNSLDHHFEEAVKCISETKDRVILTGIGKSGHVANKIAATLASTGTPSFFVHPSEASHGDLGMITTEDSVIALSESGESEELSGIISFTRRHQIPLIALTREINSTLGSAADFHLLVPAAEPACPLRLAPTTSTTMMLALGDALAIALLEWRGFSADDFKDYHPGGSLGKNLIKVQELMHGKNELPLIKEGRSIRDATLEMSEKHFGCVGIVNEQGCLTGIITDGDLRRHVVNHLDQKGLRTTLVETMMTKNPKVTTPQSLAVQTLGFMNKHNITVLFAVDSQHCPIGILHIHDCLKAGLQ